MAAKPFSVILLFPLLLTFLHLALAANLHPTTAVLDAAASLRGARQALSSSSTSPQNYTSAPPLPSNSFSLAVYPRDSVLKPSSSHRDYRDLVLSRLARDSARVDSLNAKLQLALEPDRTGWFSAEGLTAPVISGASQGSGEYFSRVGIGSPEQQFYMSLDTGSDVSWLQCLPCVNCYRQYGRIYDPASSSSYRPLSCNSEQCRALEVSNCQAGKPCLYRVTYGDGSFTEGELATETFSFGSSGAAKDIALGCGHDNEGLFVGSAGLIGLGGGSLSLTRQIKAGAFFYCLVHRDSSDSSTLEFRSSVQLRIGYIKAPLIRNEKMDTFYYVGVSGMTVGGLLLPIPPSIFRIDNSGNGGIIIDSGTAITRLQAEAYNILRDAFVQQAQALGLQPTGGIQLFDTCYNFVSTTKVQVPTVSFEFSNGESWTLPPDNYLIPMDSAKTFCFAFAPTTSSLSIIGNVQQQGARVVFDFANSIVGISPNKC